MGIFTFSKQNFLFIFLIILAFLTRFLFLSYPAEVVFDEVHFGKFISAYFSGEYYFDIHPPLGKLMIAGFYKIFNKGINFDFAEIGEGFNAKDLFILRFLPALFGSLFVILIYKLILALGLSKNFAIFGGFLVLLENSFLVESKFILVDMFLIFFGFLSLYFYFLAKNKNKEWLYLFAGISASLSFSVKWTGLSFLGIILLFSFIDILGNFGLKKLFKTACLLSFGKKFAFFILVPFLIYLFIFFIHFELLPKSGPGKDFMSQAFQKTLENNNVDDTKIQPSSFMEKFWELNKVMYVASSTLKATHPDGSQWYQWPIMKKPVWYWNKRIDGSTGSPQVGSTSSPQVAKSANIYLFGNPLIWWLVALCIPTSLLLSRVKRFYRRISPQFNILIFGFFLNLLPFIFVKRVAFLYHYLPSLTFGILILVLLMEKIPPSFRFNFSSKFLIGFLFLIALLFLTFSPLSYGFFLPEKINLYYLKIVGFFN